ncbi:Efflux pump membrane transporter BepE [Planctomycetes bacterium Pan216]|uniref:Efflux pump membrane transporter BepE n=1 Tax=Kolteria novifilia TaxID=2527975 RepID=A0A518BCS0_9BACT|nr:Efflux pump membrane transporter BepE [Planctomycetes bacterium Pan216]
MPLIRFAIENPVKVAVGVMLLILFGLVGVTRMPVQLTPEVEIPQITVATRWPGASSFEIEREIVDEQEEQLNTVEGLSKLESESSDSNGNIVLEFPVGTDIDAARQLVDNRLNQVKEYPPDADRPVISSLNSSNSRAVAWLMLRPSPGHEDEIDIEKERTFAQKIVEPELEKVNGVGAVNTFGGRERRLEVIVDPHRLAARELTIADLREALVGQNKDTSGGDVWEGKRRYVLRTLGRFRTPEQVEQVIIARRDGQPVYVRDVAIVQLGTKKPDSIVRQKGQTTIALQILRRTGANVLTLMEGLREKVDQLNNGLLAERGLELEQVYDETDYISESISLVQSNIAVAGILTFLILLIFLRNFWPTVIIGVAIPASIIGTFFLFWQFGRTLNVISLAGMAFAVGMVVDNAIVVMESIYRHFEMGKSKVQAARDGTLEVWGAVLASTLTTLAVFVPVIFIEGEAGQLFRDIALAISCAVALSLVVAVLVIPAASAQILRRGSGSGSESRLGGGFVRAVLGINRGIQRSTLARIATVVVCIGVSIGGSWLLWPSVEYLPQGNRNLLIGFLIPPPGYNYDHMVDIGKRVEKKLAPLWDPESGAAEEAGIPGIEHFFFVASARNLFMGARATDGARVAELIPPLREATGGIPGMIAVVTQTSLFENALSGGRTIDIEITGDRVEKLVEIGRQAFGMMAAQAADPASPLFGSQLRPVPGLDVANPEIHVVPKWEQAADLGISASELGYAIDALVDGAYTGDYYDENQKIDLEIIGEEQHAKRIDQLDQLYISTDDGQLVPLSVVARIELSSGPEQINHRGRRRAITIQVTPSQSTPLEIARQTIQNSVVDQLVASGVTEEGRYRVELAGTADKLTEAWSALWFNLLLAALITYLVMAGLFESFLYPLVIMASVPQAAVGGFGALFVTNLATMYFLGRVTSLDVVTMLGFVILIGTVVNNAILIVDQALQLIRDEQEEMRHLSGYDEGIDEDFERRSSLIARESVLDSTRTRIRPIFMSATTTVLGLLPLVIVPGAGSEIYRGLGSVVLGGIVVSTLLTLVLVPTLFTLVWDARQFVRDRFRRQPSPEPEEGGPSGEGESPAPAEVSTDAN